VAVSRNLWVKTEQSEEVCIMVDVYDLKVVAWASDEQITASEMVAVLKEEYHDVITFETMTDVSPGFVHAVGKREL
jgi:hypothetical protein